MPSDTPNLLRMQSAAGTKRNGQGKFSAPVKGQVHRQKAVTSRQRPYNRTLQVTDGRIALGTILELAHGFVAIDIDGVEVGRYRCLKQASRSFDPGRA
jgi:hypothetical protein